MALLNPLFCSFPVMVLAAIVWVIVCDRRRTRLDKQGPDVERRGQITGGEGFEKRAGSGTLLHSLIPNMS